MKARGFSLIELLVVIAIIGLLSSVVLATLNSARNRARDAAIQSNLATIRTQAELVYSIQGCYGDNDGSTTCADRLLSNHPCALAINADNTIFREPQVRPMIQAALAQGGLSACRATGGGAEWAIAVQLPSDESTAWCVDSFGTSAKLTISGTPDQNGLDRSVNDANSSSTGGQTMCNPNYY